MTTLTRRAYLTLSSLGRVVGRFVIDFPLIDYIDDEACYGKLVELLHLEGLVCPNCGERRQLLIEHRHREPVLDKQCGECGRVLKNWTGTVLQGTHRRPSQLMMILHSLATARPTVLLDRELGCDRKHLLKFPHRLQENARLGLDATRWMTR